jgi:hypothetical protein
MQKIIKCSNIFWSFPIQLNAKTLLDVKTGFQEKEKEKEKYTDFQIGARLVGFGCRI